MGSMEGEETCSMCRDLFGPAHPLPCGHALCPNCVRDVWTRTRSLEPGARCFACPQCEEEQRGAVLCDCCPGESRCSGQMCCAVKTCMRCEVSLCERHLQPHLHCPAYSTHLLVEPMVVMSCRRCTLHGEVFRYYCLQEGEYICADCLLEGRHADHQVKSLRQLEEDCKLSLTLLLQMAERKLTHGERILQEHQKSSISVMGSLEVDDSLVVRLGSALQHQVERLVSALNQANTEERKRLMEQLQDDSRRAEEEMKQTDDIRQHLRCLVQETDPFLLIWAFHSESSKLRAELNSPFFTPTPLSLDKKQILEQVEQKYREFISETLRCLIELKRDLLSSPLSLDTDSAHPLLKVSDDLQMVVRVKSRLPRTEHPARFDHWSQVVTKQTFSFGMHYWELEAEGFWDIAVTYCSIGRKGKEGTAFGCNEVSWSLTQQHNRKLAAWHNRKKTRLGMKLSGKRIAVALDFALGSITFSEVGPAANLVPLHHFSASFSQPVCLGFGLYKPELDSRISIIRKA